MDIMVSKSTPSIVSRDLAITGNLKTDGEIQIDGTVDGDVECGTVIIGEGGRVNGTIVADEVNIRGELRGGVTAGNVTLAPSARVEGDIVHTRLSVENGAYLDGMCRHSDNARSGQKPTMREGDKPPPPLPEEKGNGQTITASSPV